jgi:putative oxidoreductase
MTSLDATRQGKKSTAESPHEPPLALQKRCETFASRADIQVSRDSVRQYDDSETLLDGRHRSHKKARNGYGKSTMHLFELSSRIPLARWAPVPVRLIVGYGFMAHGYAKLANGPDIFVGIVDAMGVPAPFLTAWLTILVELVGGLAVLLGAFVTLFSLPMAAILLVATFTVHLSNGFTSIKLIAVTAAGAQFWTAGLRNRPPVPRLLCPVGRLRLPEQARNVLASREIIIRYISFVAAFVGQAQCGFIGLGPWVGRVRSPRRGCHRKFIRLSMQLNWLTNLNFVTVPCGPENDPESIPGVSAW